MAKRNDSVAETRQRIVDAAVELHGSLGPAATTIAAIAAAAGVTRLTVYRHFADTDAIFAACSAHWMSLQHPPRPDEWARIAAPADRLRAALTDLYRFYGEAAPMLSLVIRDAHHVPAAQRDENAAMNEHMRAVVLSAFRGRPGPRRRRLEAVVGHALSFGTWQSLCVDHALGAAEAVDVMTALVLAVAPPPARPRQDARAAGG